VPEPGCDLDLLYRKGAQLSERPPVL